MNYGFGEASFEYFESCIFSRENTNIDVSVFMFDLRMINMSSEWMWKWLIRKNIGLLDRIWRLWLPHSPTNFIFWLGRLIFSVSINSHPDNVYFSCDVVSWNLDQDEVYNIMWSSLTVTCNRSVVSPVFSTNNAHRQLLLKVALNTIKQINKR